MQVWSNSSHTYQSAHFGVQNRSDEAAFSDDDDDAPISLHLCRLAC